MAHWRKQANVYKILNGEQDLRSCTGLQRAVQRRLAKESTQVQGTLLNQYLKLVLQAKAVSPAYFSSCTTEDLHKVCQTLDSERVPFPPKFMLNILMRQVNTLVSEHRFEELVAIISPWETGLFDWKHPTLGCLADDELKKISIYRKIVFESVLCKLILRGEEQAGQVAKLCQKLLVIGSKVDRVMLEAPSAATLSESETAWHCLAALLSDAVNPDLEERCCPVSPSESNSTSVLALHLLINLQSLFWGLVAGSVPGLVTHNVMLMCWLCLGRVWILGNCYLERLLVSAKMLLWGGGLWSHDVDLSGACEAGQAIDGPQHSSIRLAQGGCKH